MTDRNKLSVAHKEKQERGTKKLPTNLLVPEWTSASTARARIRRRNALCDLDRLRSGSAHVSDRVSRCSVRGRRNGRCLDREVYTTAGELYLVERSGSLCIRSYSRLGRWECGRANRLDLWFCWRMQQSIRESKEKHRQAKYKTPPVTCYGYRKNNGRGTEKRPQTNDPVR